MFSRGGGNFIQQRSKCSFLKKPIEPVIFQGGGPDSYPPLDPRMRSDHIKLEFILKLKIKRNDWLLADTCPQAANHYALF